MNSCPVDLLIDSMAVNMFLSVSERGEAVRMADEADLSILKRKIVAVDKLVRSNQKVAPFSKFWQRQVSSIAVLNI